MSSVIVGILPYFILLIFFAAVGFKSIGLSNSVLITAYIWASIVLFASGFMRLFLYNDYDDFTQYYIHFTNFKEFADVVPFLYSDPIFYLLLFLLQLLGVNAPEVLYVSISFIFCLALLLVLKRINKVTGSLFVFLTLLSPFFVIYSGQFLRQSLALCALLFVASLQSRNARFIGILLAGAIHFSVLLVIPVAFIINIRVEKAMKVFFAIFIIALSFPFDNSFVALLSQDNIFFGKVEYWLNDNLEPAGLVYKWVPLFIVTAVVSKSLRLMYRNNTPVLHASIVGFEARVVWLLIFFTVIGFWGRYLNAFSMRFGLWAIIFCSIPLFLFRGALPKLMFVCLSIVLYLATVVNLFINKSSVEFEYIYRYVFFPASAL